MRGAALPLACLALLALLALAQRGHGQGNTVRLCGRDFVRAVVFTCGGSRWKRHWGPDPALPAEDDPPPAFPAPSDTDPAYTARGTYSKESHGAESKAQRELQQSSQKPVLTKREAARLLPTACCTVGCSRTQISSLC